MRGVKQRGRLGSRKAAPWRAPAGLAAADGERRQRCAPPLSNLRPNESQAYLQPQAAKRRRDAPARPPSLCCRRSSAGCRHATGGARMQEPRPRAPEPADTACIPFRPHPAPPPRRRRPRDRMLPCLAPCVQQQQQQPPSHDVWSPRSRLPPRPWCSSPRPSPLRRWEEPRPCRCPPQHRPCRCHRARLSLPCLLLRMCLARPPWGAASVQTTGSGASSAGVHMGPMPTDSACR